MGTRIRQVAILLAAAAPACFLVVSRRPVLSGVIVLGYHLSTVMMFLLSLGPIRSGKVRVSGQFRVLTSVVIGLEVYAGLLAAAEHVLHPGGSFFRVFGGLGSYLANTSMLIWAFMVTHLAGTCPRGSVLGRADSNSPELARPQVEEN
jgi:ABC-type microcin C transport system permease subunit YejB